MEKVTTIQNVSKQGILAKIGHGFIKVRYIITQKNTIVEIVCALFIILFIYTGLNKIIDFKNFRFQMGRSPFIQNMAGLIAATLPAGELLISIALIIKRTRLLGLYASFFLMTLFTGYIWLMLNYAFDLPCSCGGIIGAMSWNGHLIFNIGFTILAGIGAILEYRVKLKT
jgi:hypothetical protein